MLRLKQTRTWRLLRGGLDTSSACVCSLLQSGVVNADQHFGSTGVSGILQLLKFQTNPVFTQSDSTIHLLPSDPSHIRKALVACFVSPLCAHVGTVGSCNLARYIVTSSGYEITSGR